MKTKYGCAALIVSGLFFLTACTGVSSSSGSAPGENGASDSAGEAVLYGRVTAVENGVLTLETGSLQEAGLPGGEGEIPPDTGGGPGENAEAMPQGTPPAQPSDATGEPPPSAAPEDEPEQRAKDGPSGTGGFTPDGGTLTLSASQEVPVTRRGPEGEEASSFEEITVGDLLMLTGTGGQDDFTPAAICLLGSADGAPEDEIPGDGGPGDGAGGASSAPDE